MSNDVVIYSIDLPEEQDPEAFVTFMRERYLPAVHRGPTRVGQTLEVILWKAELLSEAAEHQFFLHMVWSGLRSSAARIRLDDAEAVESELQSFGAKMRRLGFYTEAARWSGQEVETAG